jgi:hypothetical protein
MEAESSINTLDFFSLIRQTIITRNKHEETKYVQVSCHQNAGQSYKFSDS